MSSKLIKPLINISKSVHPLPLLSVVKQQFTQEEIITKKIIEKIDKNDKTK